MTNLTPGQKAALTRRRKREQLDLGTTAAAPIAAIEIAGLCYRTADGYRAATRDEIMEAAAAYLAPLAVGETLGLPSDSVRFFRPLVAGRQHETFSIAYLDARHRVIKVENLFRGTIDGATVYPREVVRAALSYGASAVVLAHNHPSGVPEPSENDRAITTKLARALAMVEIRLLDHLVLTNDSHVSMAERGLV